MNPTGIITAVTLFAIGSGYLWTEGCISIAARSRIEHPTAIASLATRGAPVFVLAVILWLAWALYQERSTDTRPKRKIHITVGIIGCVSLFLFYLYAGLNMVGVTLVGGLR